MVTWSAVVCTRCLNSDISNRLTLQNIYCQAKEVKKKTAPDQLLWSYLVSLFQGMLLLKYVEYLKYLDQHCRAQITEGGLSYCIAKYSWIVVRLASYSCKMLPLQSSFKLQCICLSHKIFHFEATIRGKPFEMYECLRNLGTHCKIYLLKLHICPNFKIYSLKLQSVFVGKH